MRHAVLATGLLCMTACTGASPSSSGDHAPNAVESGGSGKCEAGRRLGFVFWGRGKSPEAQAVLRRRFKEGAPKAALFRIEDEGITILVPDEETGLQVVEVARDLHLKIKNEDYVGVSVDCQLTWMNHGVDVAALQSKPKGADSADAGPPSDAGPPDASKPDATAKPDAGAKPEPTAEAKACDEALKANGTEYGKAVDHQTSVASTKMLLRLFAKACAPTFPDLAKAADKASKVGRKERSRLLGAASTSFCPSIGEAKNADDIVKTCAPIEGGADLAVWKALDPGTYAFTQLLKKAGVKSTVVDELILQASLHPELDR